MMKKKTLVSSLLLVVSECLAIASLLTSAWVKNNFSGRYYYNISQVNRCLFVF